MNGVCRETAGETVSQVEQMLNQIGAEGPMRDWILRAMSGEISTITVTFTFFTNVIAYSLFAMIGGILTIALLNKRKARDSRGRTPNS